MKSEDYSAASTLTLENSFCIRSIVDHCKTYTGSDTRRSVIQLAVTLALFFATCAAMFAAFREYYWVSALLTVPAAGLLTRIFTFQHDCGHGSYFNSRKANDWTGRFLGLLTFTPYDFWRRSHNMHHATSGDIDRRSIGGIDTITVREYNALSKKQQFFYRLYRNPVMLLIIGTPFYIIIMQRIPFQYFTHFHDNYQTLPPRSVWKSIMLNNAALVLFYGTISMFTGLTELTAVYLPIVVMTSWLGGWLFYIQHQFEDTYWKNNKDWNIHEAALLGSSYYTLPKILQWFTGNIGLHHIHHLCSKIPNYKLQECMDAMPSLEQINRLSLSDSIQCLKLKLWDEDSQTLVGIEGTSAAS